MASFALYPVLFVPFAFPRRTCNVAPAVAAGRSCQPIRVQATESSCQRHARCAQTGAAVAASLRRCVAPSLGRGLKPLNQNLQEEKSCHVRHRLSLECFDSLKQRQSSLDFRKYKCRYLLLKTVYFFSRRFVLLWHWLPPFSSCVTVSKMYLIGSFHRLRWVNRGQVPF